MIAMAMMIAIPFSERSETRQRPKMAATVTLAFAVFFVSSSNLISIAAGDSKEAKYEEEQYWW